MHDTLSETNVSHYMDRLLRCWQGGGQQVRAPVEAPNMLWLIQRDFLEGKTVQQMVSEALSEVPNPTRNGDIAQVLS